ncbi:hypothetical protein ACHAWO_003658 [Cyclotella atomus]|uniref:WSC domain-containing protein n=1 Tax=Cyclotella atomus TaxID=382360 RepID=A0ABD3N967_9STRA
MSASSYRVAKIANENTNPSIHDHIPKLQKPLRYLTPHSIKNELKSSNNLFTLDHSIAYVGVGNCQDVNGNSFSGIYGSFALGTAARECNKWCQQNPIPELIGFNHIPYNGEVGNFPFLNQINYTAPEASFAIGTDGDGGIEGSDNLGVEVADAAVTLPPTKAPTNAPVTPSPTKAPATGSPTKAPVINAPVTQSPTKAPTIIAPVTPSPTKAPVTPSPTKKPVINTPKPNGSKTAKDTKGNMTPKRR